MKKIYFNIMSAALLLSVSLGAAAQEFRTSYFMKTSNLRHQMNPALLEDSYFTTPVLGNLNIGATGNVGYKNFVYKLQNNPEYTQTTFVHPSVSASQFLGDLSDNNKIDVYANINIFSVGFKAFGGTNLIEMNVRSNTNVALPKELFEFMKLTGAREHYSFSDLGVRSQNYAEIALGHSRNINDKLRVGAKLKFLVGMAYADLDVDRMDITMNGDYWRIAADTRLNAGVLDSKFEYDEDPETNAPDGRRRVKGLDDVAFGVPGFGMAVDLGATYRLNDDWTFSAAVTDLGFIGWSGTKTASSQGDYTFDGFEDIYAKGDEAEEVNKIGEQFDRLGDDLEEMFSVYDDGEKSVSQMLAATVNVGAEYTLPVYRNLRFGFLYTGRIHGIYSYHQAMLSANVRPVKWFEAVLNTTASTTGFMFGGAISFKAPHFNFFLGSDRILGKVNKQFIPLNNMNANVCMGMSIPL